MKYQDKRADAQDRSAVQEGNQQWWTDNTMSYDWNDKSGLERFTSEWYDDIDRRFLYASRLHDDTENPFAALMGLDDLRGKRVLEIGCGMGFHSQLLASSGAELTSVDLSPTSIEATTRRLALRNLESNIIHMDAEKLEFDDASFDMVWSWGVIHHSARTGQVVRQIERVLRPGGSARLMVYNMAGMPAYRTLVLRYLLGFWFGKSLDELLWRDTDGYTARYYTRDTFGDLLGAFFPEVEVSVLGQHADVLPLPRRLREPLLKLIPVEKQRRAARRWGAFVYAVAHKAQTTG